MSAPTVAPHRPEAEISVLGACLQDRTAAQTACELLTPTDFFDLVRGEVFGIVKSLVAHGVPPDLVTVFQTVTDRTVQERVTATLLQDLVDQTPTAANVAHHARIVKDLAARRNLAALCTHYRDAATRDGADLAALVDEMQVRLARVTVAQTADGPDLVCLSDVTPETVSWLWPGRIPRGKLSLIIGDPGQGKSCVTMDTAARVSSGLAWPDGGQAPRGGVVLLTAEDGLRDTVRPRLDAMGADVARVVALLGVKVPGKTTPAPFRLAEDVAHLETAIKSVSAVLVVVDPVSAYLGKADSYKDAEVRGVLAPLAALAERTGAAVEAVMHLTKDAQRKVLYRAQGSLAFVAASRAVFAVAEDQENPERRLFLPVKNNLGPKPHGLAFRLVNTGLTPRVEWDADPVTVDVDAALAGPEAAQERSERSEAKDFLADALGAGPVATTQIQKQARAAGIAERTLDRAKADLGVRSRKNSYSGEWEWCLPDAKGAKNATPTYRGNGGTLGTLGKLAEVDL